MAIENICTRCLETPAKGFSWFTGQEICQKCLDKEDALLVKLSENGQDIWDYEGCGYVPKEDGSNWIEKDRP